MSQNKDGKKTEELKNKLREYLVAHDHRALDLIRELARIAEEDKDAELMGYACYRYAYFYYFISRDIYKFRKYVQLAIKYLLRCENKEFLGGAYNLVAYDAQDQGCYDVAYAFYTIAVKALEEDEDSALSGLIDASAGKLLILLGEWEEGRTQQRKAIRVISRFKDMHVYHYNMIITYSDITLASFLLNDIKTIISTENEMEKHYRVADSDEKDICRIYCIMTGIYKALLSADEDLLDRYVDELTCRWKTEGSDISNEMMDLLFEIESICGYMLEKGYLSQAKKVIEAADPMADEDKPADAIRYYTLNIMFMEKAGDKEGLRLCLHKQHMLQKKQVAETMRNVHYSMEFSDMVGAIAKERRKAAEENLDLQKKVNTDALTGLPNRNAMNVVFEEKYSEALEKGTSFGIGIIDVDDFKLYNDMHGHQEGDRCLKSVGRALLPFLERPEIFCCRYGGDEFIVGYFGLSDEEITEVKEEMERSIVVESIASGTGSIRISQGVHNGIPGDHIKLWDYLTYADKELYSIKNRNDGDKTIKDYAHLTARIREMLSPRAGEMEDPGAYYKTLKATFEHIGECARINDEILNRCYYPLIEKEGKLSENDLETIEEFSRVLVNAGNLESIDIPIYYNLSLRLLKDAEAKGDVKQELKALDNLTMAAFSMLLVTYRLYPSSNIMFRFRDMGYDAACKILNYLEPEKFADLPDDECREIVLVNARYMTAFSEWMDKENYIEMMDMSLGILERSLALCDDPFYLEKAPNYDWEYHKFRALQYYSDIHEYWKYRYLNKEQCEKAAYYAGKLKDFVETHPRFEDACNDVMLTYYVSRNEYIAGKITKEEYKQTLLKLYQKRRMDEFDILNLHLNFMVPYEYLSITDKEELTTADMDFISEFYREMIEYIYTFPYSSVLSFLLTCLSEILHNYIEVPGAPNMEEMVLELIAALHPLTYVHTLTVSDIAVCLCEGLLEREPRRFIGLLGTKTEEDVEDKQKDIIEFARHAAMLHDTGKLFILETIITYGRNLFAKEFDMIHVHPQVGAELLSSHESTAPYAFAAMGHHKWYDRSKGYPENDMDLGPGEDVILDIVTVSDCLDAATDHIGRNYKKGLTLDDFAEELEKGRDTRYAGYLADLLKDPDMKDKLSNIVENVRVENYGKAFTMLRRI